MKERTYKTGLVLTAILTCLLMISTATAVPVATSEPVMELTKRQEKIHEITNQFTTIKESNSSIIEKIKQLKSTVLVPSKLDNIIMIIGAVILSLILYPILLSFPQLNYLLGEIVFMIIYYMGAYMFWLVICMFALFADSFWLLAFLLPITILIFRLPFILYPLLSPIMAYITPAVLSYQIFGQVYIAFRDNIFDPNDWQNTTNPFPILD